jgi:hypothetical protein
MSKLAKSRNDLSQFERFKQAARELGCDESEERFVETVRKLAAAPPTRNAPSKGKKKPASK